MGDCWSGRCGRCSACIAKIAKAISDVVDSWTPDQIRQAGEELKAELGGPEGKAAEAHLDAFADDKEENQ